MSGKALDAEAANTSASGPGCEPAAATPSDTVGSPEPTGPSDAAGASNGPESIKDRIQSFWLRGAKLGMNGGEMSKPMTKRQREQLQGCTRSVTHAVVDALAIEQEVIGPFDDLERGLGQFWLKEQRFLDEVGHPDRVWRQIRAAALDLAVTAMRIAICAEGKEPYIPSQE